MQTQEHTWSLPSRSSRPLRALQYAIRSWGKSSSSGEATSYNKPKLVIQMISTPGCWSLLQGTCSVRSRPDLLLGLAHCSCFCPSQCPMGEPLQLSYNKTAHIHLFLPNLLCGQSFLLWCCCTSLLTFFFFVASHDPWQTQPPPWWWWVPAAQSMEQPSLANWYICLQSQDKPLWYGSNLCPSEVLWSFYILL